MKKIFNNDISISNEFSYYFLPVGDTFTSKINYNSHNSLDYNIILIVMLNMAILYYSDIMLHL